MKIPAWMAAAALIVAALASPAPAVMPTPGAVPSYCLQTSFGYRCMVGPFNVGEGEMLETMTGVAAPSEKGYFTSMQARLVDSEGDKLGHHSVHLHHAVWLNPYKEDMTCDEFDGSLPDFDRFFATGKESTKVDLPSGYGYLWDPQISQPATQSAPWWALIAHLDGMAGAPDVFIQFDLSFVPANKRKLTPVKTVWLDVRNCRSDPVYDVPRNTSARVHHKSWTYRMPRSGRFVFLGGHLHDGGLRLALTNRSSGRKVFTSRPTYGMAGERWYLTKMSTYSRAPGMKVARGDLLRLTAVYDSTHRWKDVMGIMVGAFAPR